MRRSKVYAPSSTTSTTSASVTTMTRPAVVYRAAAATAQAPARPAPAASPASRVHAEINHTGDFAAAALVPIGKSVSAGRVALVAPGAMFTPTPDVTLRGFIHRDRSAVKFAGTLGEVHLDPSEAASEFGPLLSNALRLLAAHPLAVPAPAKPTPKPATSKPVHRAAATQTAPSSDAATALSQAAKTAGTPLPSSTRSKLEASYGTNLGSVRVHTDSSADTAAKAVQAHAFTTGNDVYFRAGQYRPNTPTGEKLIAHEVAHTVQQSTGESQVARQADSSGVQVTSPGDRVEREADAAAEQAVRGQPATLRGAAPTVARLADAPSVKPAPANAVEKKEPVPTKGVPKGSISAGGPPDEAAKGKPKAEKAGKSKKEEAHPGGEAKATGKESTAPSAETSAGGGLHSVLAGVAHAGKEQKKHDPAEKKANEAQQAVEVSAEQAAGMGKGDQVGHMASQKKSPFDAAKFKANLRAKIQSLKADDAKKIEESDSAGAINYAVKSEVVAGQQQAGGGIVGAAKQEPPKGEAQQGAPLAPTDAGLAPKVDAAKAVPLPVPEEKVSMAGESQAIDNKMAAENISPEQLQKSNEPAFQAADAERTTAKTEAEALPAQARTGEQKQLAKAKGEVVAVATTGLAGMHGKRSEQLTASEQKQAEAKAKYEATKKRISDELSGIYTNTKKAVDDRMAKLETDVSDIFTKGADSAKSSFNWFLRAKLLVYYVGGGWLADKLTGENNKEKIFEEGRRRYMDDMELVISDIATAVETGLNETVAILAEGKAKLDAALAKLGPDEKSIGEEAASGIRGQFSELEKSIEAKQEAIITSVAEKYVAAQKDIEATIEAYRNPVGALISMATEALGGVFETIGKLKELLMSALAKAQAAIGLIIADPIGFLGNLVTGVKQGLMNFVGNIETHLQKGLFEWLFGALAKAGIQMPDKFDLSGIMSIVFQVLGLTWTNIRKRAVAIVGEKVVSALETASEIIVTLVTKGVSGLWEWVKEKAINLMGTVLGEIKSFLVEKVIMAGVTWIIGLLNPASAFIKACKAIYDIVMWVVNNGQQLLEFVNAVLDSVLSIAKGNIAPAAAAVEKALSKAVPVAIGFLAGLLGLGGLSDKIKEVIAKIQAPVNAIIDWLIKKAVQLAKAVGKLFGGKEKKEEKPLSALPDFETQNPTNMDGESHTLKFVISGGQASVTIESSPAVLATVAAQAIESVQQSPRKDEDKKYIILQLKEVIANLDPEKIESSLTKGRKPEEVASIPKDVIKKFVDARLQKGADDLLALGNKFHVGSIQAFFRSKTPDRRYLPIGYDVRTKLYERGSSYDSKLDTFAATALKLVRSKLLAMQQAKDYAKWDAAKSAPELIVHPDAELDQFDIKEVHRGKEGSIYDYQVDHILPLAKHWSAGGNNDAEAPRASIATDSSNLQFITQHANASKGAEDKNYFDWVGKGFSSAESPANSLDIDGQPFLDKNKKPIA